MSRHEPAPPGNAACLPALIERARTQLELEDAAALLAEPVPPRGWLLGTVLCRDFVTVLAASGGTGKTTLMLTWALALATGRRLAYFYVHRRARVLVITAEDTRSELQRRLRACCIQHAIDAKDLHSWLFVKSLNGVGVTFATAGADGAMQETETATGIIDVITAKNIDAVMLDPFIKVSGAPENDNTATDFVCRLLSRIAEAGHVAVAVAHHYRKGPNPAGNIDGARGARSLIDGARIALTLQSMTAEEAASMRIPESERLRLVRLDDGKLNLTPAGEARWFRLVSVNIDNATGDYPRGDNMQAIEAWTPPDAFEGLSAELLNRVLDTIDAGMPEGQRFSPHNAAKDRAAWRVVQSHAPNKSEQHCRAIVKAWLQSGLLTVVEYKSATDRKPRKGLAVNASKRPININQ